MKAVYCLSCGDFKALQTEPVSCKCRRCHGRWTDPELGLAIFCETDPEGNEPSDLPGRLRMLGIHNAALGVVPDYLAWEQADGYIFKQRKSMIINIKPGYSKDTRWTNKAEVFSTKVGT